MKSRLALLLCGLRVTACGTTVPLSERGAANLDNGLSPATSAPTTDLPSTGAAPRIPPGTADLPSTSVDPGTAPVATVTGGPALPTVGASVGSAVKAPVEIGLVVAQDLGPAAKSLGYDGLSTGNGKAQANALVTYFNAHGGLGGHQIKPVVFEAKASDSSSDISAEVCSLFTVDHHVKAVITWSLLPSALPCFTRAKVPVISSSVNTVSEKTLAKNPYLLLTYMLTIEEAAKNLTAGLVAQNWFRKASPEPPVIGLITHDDPEYANVEGIVRSGLAAAGLKLKDVFLMPVDGVERAGAAGKAAALHFAADGVNRVMAVDRNGFGMSWFTIGASTQGYYPKLGVSTLSEPSVGPTVLTPKQLAGSAGIGWSTLMDTSPAMQPATSARTAICVRMMMQAGEDMSVATVRLSAMSLCDGAFALADILRSGDVSPTGFLNGLRSVGSTFQSPVSFATDFSRSRAPIRGYKAIAYEAGCDCYRYSGPLQLVR